MLNPESYRKYLVISSSTPVLSKYGFLRFKLLKSTQPNEYSLHLFRLNCTMNLTKVFANTLQSLANLSLAENRWVNGEPKPKGHECRFLEMGKGLSDDDDDDPRMKSASFETYSIKSGQTHNSLSSLSLGGHQKYIRFVLRPLDKLH